MKLGPYLVSRYTCDLDLSVLKYHLTNTGESSYLTVASFQGKTEMILLYIHITLEYDNNCLNGGSNDQNWKARAD